MQWRKQLQNNISTWISLLVSSLEATEAKIYADTQVYKEFSFLSKEENRLYVA